MPAIDINSSRSRVLTCDLSDEIGCRPAIPLPNDGDVAFGCGTGEGLFRDSATNPAIVILERWMLSK